MLYCRRLAVEEAVYLLVEQTDKYGPQLVSCTRVNRLPVENLRPTLEGAVVGCRVTGEGAM